MDIFTNALYRTITNFAVQELGVISAEGVNGSRWRHSVGRIPES